MAACGLVNIVMTLVCFIDGFCFLIFNLIQQAIERRRARLREAEGLQLSSRLPQGQSVHSPSVPVSVAPLEHELSLSSPSPTIKIRRCPPTVGRMPKDIT